VAGGAIQRALEVEAALQAGITVTLDDVQADEFGALRVLAEERARLQQESAGSVEQQNP